MQIRQMHRIIYIFGSQTTQKGWKFKFTCLLAVKYIGFVFFFKKGFKMSVLLLLYFRRWQLHKHLSSIMPTSARKIIIITRAAEHHACIIPKGRERERMRWGPRASFGRGGRGWEESRDYIFQDGHE